MTIVTVEDVKAHANIDISEDDALLQGKIAAAEEWIEKFIGTPLADFAPTPEPLKEAVRQLVAHFYENREAVLVGVSADELPFGVHDLMAPYREWAF